MCVFPSDADLQHTHLGALTGPKLLAARHLTKTGEPVFGLRAATPLLVASLWPNPLQGACNSEPGGATAWRRQQAPGAWGRQPGAGQARAVPWLRLPPPPRPDRPCEHASGRALVTQTATHGPGAGRALSLAQRRPRHCGQRETAGQGPRAATLPGRNRCHLGRGVQCVCGGAGSSSHRPRVGRRQGRPRGVGPVWGWGQRGFGMRGAAAHPWVTGRTRAQQLRPRAQGATPPAPTPRVAAQQAPRGEHGALGGAVLAVRVH